MGSGIHRLPVTGRIADSGCVRKNGPEIWSQRGFDIISSGQFKVVLFFHQKSMEKWFPFLDFLRFFLSYAFQVISKFDSMFSKSSDKTKTLAIFCIWGITLPSYVGIIISQYKDRYKPTSI